MINFHEKYAAVEGLPGYFWNLEEGRLYSIKIQGVMKRLTVYNGNRFTYKHIGISKNDKYYQLSKNGNRVYRTRNWIRNNLIYEDTIS